MNPEKPLTRPMRRVLFHLLKGGMLVQVFCRRRKGATFRPDPTRWHFTLYPNKGEGGPRPYCANKPIRDFYFVRRDKVEALIERGYLMPLAGWREKGEARRIDLILPAAEEVVAKTDENGAIRTRPIPPPLGQSTRLRNQLREILERSRAMRDQWDDYRFTQEARDRDLKIIWQCDTCHRRHEDYPGFNEGGTCSCGGTFEQAGESYDMGEIA